jgi:hypothetical protein
MTEEEFRAFRAPQEAIIGALRVENAMLRSELEQLRK